MRAWVDLTVAIHLSPEDRTERFSSAEADLGKALRLRPETADAHVALGLLRLHTNRADQGIAECERGLAIDRNHPHAHALIGVGKTLTGRYEETEAHVLEALRISPHDRRAGMWLMIAASAKLLAWTCLGKVESSSEGKRSISWASRSDGSGRNLKPKPFGWLR
jgi:tetratricopeptide (TPR) repeat protein